MGDRGGRGGGGGVCVFALVDGIAVVGGGAAYGLGLGADVPVRDGGLRDSGRGARADNACRGTGLVVGREYGARGECAGASHAAVGGSGSAGDEAGG